VYLAVTERSLVSHL